MSSELESLFEQAVKPGPNRLAAGFCFAAINNDGSKRIQRAYGTTTISGDTPFEEDSFIWIASLTKLVTAVAVLQCVEKGLFSLDSAEDVARILPEVSKLQVISAFDAENKEVSLEPQVGHITLRMLMMHVNGMGYDSVQPALLTWRASRGESYKWLCGDLKKAYETPLVAQPGKAFNYSPGFDWAGLMVERTTKISLGDYFEKYIFAPLGMKNTLFDEERRPDLLSRLVPAVRHPEPNSPLEDGEMPDHAKTHCKDHLGGAGLYSTASDYLDLLSAILRKDESLLSQSSYSLIMTGNLDSQCKESLNSFISIPIVRPMFGMGLPDGETYDLSVAALVTQNDIPGLAKKGTFGWVGVCNHFWDIVESFCNISTLVEIYQATNFDVKFGSTSGKSL